MDITLCFLSFFQGIALNSVAYLADICDIYPCSITRMSHIYTCFVTNICHYFDLLDEICGKIHAVI